MSEPRFRADIQGLRAYAVLAVLLYHFGITALPAGFAGVDVFFVISGFLMATIIAPSVESGTFSFGQFYFGRLRRIFPALAVLVVALSAFAWLWLGPSDLIRFGDHAASSLAFLSNFIYRSEDGYFAEPSRDAWLLHSWSLSVEAQFYLLFPLVLCYLRRARRAVMLGLMAASFTLMVATVEAHPSFAFYLLPARAWELLAGAYVFLYVRRPASDAMARFMQWLGFTMILGALALIDDSMLWPNFLTLGPVLGCLLILAAGGRAFWPTDNAVARTLGNWSYSIYLWHWPLAVGMLYFGRSHDMDWVLGGIAASIALGMVSYYMVEQPGRRLANRAPRRYLAATLGLVALGLLGAVYNSSQGGFPQRVSEDVRIADAERKNRSNFQRGCGMDTKTGTLKPCVIGDGGDVRFVLWGDSHVGNIATALRDTVQRGIHLLSHNCGTLFGTEIHTKGKNRCREFNQHAFEAVKRTPKDTAVIVANRYAVNLEGPNEGTMKPWGFVYYDAENHAMAVADPKAMYRERLTQTLCAIAKERPLYVLKPTHEPDDSVPRRQVRRLIIDPDAPDLWMDRAAYEQRNRDVLPALEYAAKQCGFTLLDPTPYYCDAGKCRLTLDRRPLFIDNNHISDFGNRLLLPLFEQHFGTYR